MVYSIPFQGVCRYAPFSKIIIHLVDDLSQLYPIRFHIFQSSTRWKNPMAMASWRNEQTGRPANKHFGHFQSPSGKSIINGNQIYNTPEVFEYITIYQYSKLEHHHISPSGIVKQIGHFPQYPINLPSIFNSYRKHINMS